MQIRARAPTGMEETISRPLGPQSRNRFDGAIRKDTARGAIMADLHHSALSQLEPSPQLGSGPYNWTYAIVRYGRQHPKAAATDYLELISTAISISSSGGGRCLR